MKTSHIVVAAIILFWAYLEYQWVMFQDSSIGEAFFGFFFLSACTLLAYAVLVKMVRVFRTEKNKE